MHYHVSNHSLTELVSWFPIFVVSDHDTDLCSAIMTKFEMYRNVSSFELPAGDVCIV